MSSKQQPNVHLFDEPQPVAESVAKGTKEPKVITSAADADQILSDMLAGATLVAHFGTIDPDPDNPIHAHFAVRQTGSGTATVAPIGIAQFLRAILTRSRGAAFMVSYPSLNYLAVRGYLEVCDAEANDAILTYRLTVRGQAAAANAKSRA